jgi:hypothetical protein
MYGDSVANSLIAVILLLAFTPVSRAADDSGPRVKFNWPAIEVESTKYHLSLRFLNSDSYAFPVLIKEEHSVELIDGREGQNSRITLELWLLSTENLDRKLWQISQEADSWQYYNWEEIVLTKYGCCDSLNKYSFYDFKTGALLRAEEGRVLPSRDNEESE